MEPVKIIECPRDAIQGIKEFIPTEDKIKYINQLIKLGFYAIDFGSFVSPKAIPQMSDTIDVLNKLNINQTKLLAIVGNLRGAKAACSFDKVSCIGYPFSISNEFLIKNLNTTIHESFKTVRDMLAISNENDKNLVVYISMAFGNPYLDFWEEGHLMGWVSLLVSAGVKIISLSDTIGLGYDKDIKGIFERCISNWPEIEFGLHAHTTDSHWYYMVDEAYKGGCRRFDAVIDGKGGCPLSGYEMLGNLKTRHLLEYVGSGDTINLDNLNMIY